MYDAAAIIRQVTNGNGAMPAFSSKLSGEQIEDVAAYVLSQADNGWAK
jgi:cytochrome c6